MGIVFRQSAKNILVLALGALLGALAIWLSSTEIDKQPLGVIRNITNNAVLASQMMFLGLNHTLIVFIHRYKEDDARRKLLLTISLLLPALLITVVAIIYFLCRTWVIGHYQPEDIPYMQRFYFWLPLFTFFMMYMILLEQYLGTHMKVAASAFVREVVLRACNILLILAYAAGYIGFDTLVAGTVLIFAIPVVAFLFMSGRTPGFGLSFNWRLFTRAEYKEIIHFSWYHFLLSVSMALLNYLDVQALPIYARKGLSALPIYTNAVFIISFLYLPSKALIAASFPALARTFAEKDLEKAKDIFVRSSLNILIPTIGITVLIYCNMHNVVALLKTGYAEVVPVFFILSIGALVNIATGMNDQVLSINNYYKFNFYVSIVLIVVLLTLIRIFVPLYGVFGAAWSTVTTIVLFNIVKTVFVWKKLAVQPFSRRSVRVLIAGVPAFAAGYLLPHLFGQSKAIYVPFADAAIRCLVIALIYIGMLVWLKPSEDLETYLSSIRKNKRLF